MRGNYGKVLKNFVHGVQSHLKFSKISIGTLLLYNLENSKPSEVIFPRISYEYFLLALSYYYYYYYYERF